MADNRSDRDSGAKGNRASAALKKAFRSYVFDGILLILSGIALLIWPETALKFFFIALGAVFLLAGIVKTLLFFFRKESEPSPVDLLIGLIQIGIGVALIAASGFFIALFQYVVAALLGFGAVLLFGRAFLLRKEKGPLFAAALFFAVLTVIFAVVIAWNPEAIASFAVRLCGVGLILVGLAMVIVLRKRKTAVRKADGGEVVADVTDSAEDRSDGTH